MNIVGGLVGHGGFVCEFSGCRKQIGYNYRADVDSKQIQVMNVICNLTLRPMACGFTWLFPLGMTLHPPEAKIL